jgi:hypothetical protein
MLELDIEGSPVLGVHAHRQRLSDGKLGTQDIDLLRHIGIRKGDSGRGKTK